MKNPPSSFRSAFLFAHFTSGAADAITKVKSSDSARWLEALKIIYYTYKKEREEKEYSGSIHRDLATLCFASYFFRTEWNSFHHGGYTLPAVYNIGKAKKRWRRREWSAQQSKEEKNECFEVEIDFILMGGWGGAPSSLCECRWCCTSKRERRENTKPQYLFSELMAISSYSRSLAAASIPCFRLGVSPGMRTLCIHNFRASRYRAAVDWEHVGRSVRWKWPHFPSALCLILDVSCSSHEKKKRCQRENVGKGEKVVQQRNSLGVFFFAEIFVSLTRLHRETVFFMSLLLFASIS